MQNVLQEFTAQLSRHEWVGPKLLSEFESQIQKVLPPLSVSLPFKASIFYKVNRPEDIGGQSSFENLVHLTDPKAKWIEGKEREGILAEALGLIGEHAPVRDLCREFLWVDQVHYRGASNPKAMGAIFLGHAQVQTARALAISIVHEMAHQELFGLNLVDPLVPKGSTQESYSPFQGKARPPLGRLHSAHALYRMIGFEKIIAPELVSSHQDLLASTIKTFAASDLTEFGHQLCHTIYTRVLV